MFFFIIFFFYLKLWPKTFSFFKKNLIQANTLIHGLSSLLDMGTKNPDKFTDFEFVVGIILLIFAFHTHRSPIKSPISSGRRR